MDHEGLVELNSKLLLFLLELQNKNKTFLGYKTGLNKKQKTMWNLTVRKLKQFKTMHQGNMAVFFVCLCIF